MIGSKALSWSDRPPPRKLTVTSWPITAKAIWFTSGMTGLTGPPGMIEEPACTADGSISPNPPRGPDARRRRSLQTFRA